MKLIRYLFNKAMLPLYTIAAAVIAAVIALFSDEFLSVFLRMLPIVLSLLVTLRTFDDIFDYKFDRGRKTQHLSIRALIIFACVMSVAYVALNVLFYGMRGAVSVVAIGYILLMEKLPVLKMAYMALLFLYYFRINCHRLGVLHLAVCAGCLVASAGFHIYKLYRRRVRK